MVRTTLDSCVRAYLNEKDESSPHQYARMVAIAKSGLKEMNLDIASTTKVIEMDVDQNSLTAPLPNDYITYKRIGMCVNGRIIPLGYNPLLCIDRTYTDCGNIQPPCSTNPTEEQNSNNTVYDSQLPYTTPLHFRNGDNLGAFFGIGGGNNSLGYYRIVEEYGEIQFANLTNKYPVVLEYLADIEKQGADYSIHPFLVEAVKAWMGWATIRNKDGMAQSEIFVKRKEYYNQRRLAAQRYSGFTLDEAYQYSRLAFKSSPKV